MKQIRKDLKRRRRADEVRGKERRAKSGLVDERRVECKLAKLNRSASSDLRLATKKRVGLIEREKSVSSTGRRSRSVSGGSAADGACVRGKVTKVRNRCVDTGRGRSVIRWFRRSGRQVRERGRKGRLEGVYRVSW
jgi:ribosomal protein S14